MKPFKLFLNGKGLSGLVFITAFSLLLTFGCSKDEKGKDAAQNGLDKSAVVAKVEDNEITVAEFEGFLSDRSTLHRRISKKDLEKRLDDMVLEEVLYQEALRLKLDQDPEIRKRIRGMLTQKLIEDKLNKEVWSKELTEKELQKYYDQHRNQFNRPEQVRLADIFIPVPAGASNEEKRELKTKAESILTEAQAVKNQRTGFGKLIRTHSGKHDQYRKGDTGFFDIEGKPLGIDKALAEAAFKIDRVGNIADQVIETPDGYHVVMLIGKRSAVHTPLDTVRNQLKQKIQREAVTKIRQEYIESLKKEAETRVYDPVIAELEKELKTKQANKSATAMSKKMQGGAPVPTPFGRQKDQPEKP